MWALSPDPIRCQRDSSGRAHKLVLQVLGGHVFALRQLKHVLDAVHHAEAPVCRQLAHIAGVEEPIAICPAQRCPSQLRLGLGFHYPEMELEKRTMSVFAMTMAHQGLLEQKKIAVEPTGLRGAPKASSVFCLSWK